MVKKVMCFGISDADILRDLVRQLHDENVDASIEEEKDCVTIKYGNGELSFIYFDKVDAMETTNYDDFVEAKEKLAKMVAVAKGIIND